MHIYFLFVFSGLLVSALLACFFGVCYLFFDPLVKHIVLRRLVLRNNSEFAQIWENPPITPHLKVHNTATETTIFWPRKTCIICGTDILLCLFQVYFFNLTNPDAVFAGEEQPNVTEVGPYVYQ